jgi:hypothetical protein
MTGSVSPRPRKKNTLFTIRPAIGSDVEAICGFDHIASHDQQRRTFIERCVGAAQCFVIEADQRVVGYVVLEFTSTNLSNIPMQSLLAKMGYLLSGVIHHLDEDDPELVYVKYLNND